MDNSLHRVKIVKVSNRPYRVCRRNSQEIPKDDDSSHCDEPESVDNDGLEVDNVLVVKLDRQTDGVFVWQKKLNSALVGRVVGAKYRHFSAISKQFNVSIKSRPKSSKSATTIVVKGENSKSVRSAAMRVLERIAWVRRSSPITHFVAVNLSAIGNRLNDFRSEIGTDFNNDRLFQLPQRFHLTVCPLCVAGEDSDELLEICECVGNVIADIRNRPEWIERKVELKVAGLDCMQQDVSKAHVVYAKIAEKPVAGHLRLQELADLIQVGCDYLGYSKNSENRSEVLLHATVMNSSFAVSGEDGTGSRETFNAESVLKSHGSFDFGSVEVDKVSLVQRRAFGEDGFYRVIKTFEF